MRSHLEPSQRDDQLRKRRALFGSPLIAPVPVTISQRSISSVQRSIHALFFLASRTRAQRAVAVCCSHAVRTPAPARVPRGPRARCAHFPRAYLPRSTRTCAQGRAAAARCRQGLDQPEPAATERCAAVRTAAAAPIGVLPRLWRARAARCARWVARLGAAATRIGWSERMGGQSVLVGVSGVYFPLETHYEPPNRFPETLLSEKGRPRELEP